MFVPVEPCPGDSDSVLDLYCFLLLKCNFLPKMFRTLIRRWYLNFNVVDLHFFSLVRTLVGQNFRLVSVDFQSCIFSTLLEVAHHFLELHQRGSTSSTKRRFVRQSDS